MGALMSPFAKAEKHDFENQVKKIREIQSMLDKLKKVPSSVIDEINYSINVSSISYFEMIKGIPGSKLKEFPKQLVQALEVYKPLKELVSEIYGYIKDDGVHQIQNYIDIRVKMVSALVNIKRGLLSAATMEMQEVVDLIKKVTPEKRNYPVSYFKQFWEEYKHGRHLFENFFLFAFPEPGEKHILEEIEFSKAFEKSLQLEKQALSFAISGDYLSAEEKAKEWFDFMNNFTLFAVVPKKTIPEELT